MARQGPCEDELCALVQVLDRAHRPPAPPKTPGDSDPWSCYCAVCDLNFCSRQNLVMHWGREVCRQRSAEVQRTLGKLSGAQFAALMSRFDTEL